MAELNASQTQTDTHITLSRRNLETLLAGLDTAEYKLPVIHRVCDGHRVVVIAEENDAHYGDRPAGQMEDGIEEVISKPAGGVA